MRILALFLLFAVVPGFSSEGVVPRDGFELHYRTEGAGKPVILLSGGPGFEVEYMKEAAALFPSAWQFVYLEQRGTGRSLPPKLTTANMTVNLAVADLEALRLHLNLDRLFLVGHSWGGMLAMAYAAQHPQSVERLILIGSGGIDNTFESWFWDNIEARLTAEEKAAFEKLKLSSSEPNANLEKITFEQVRLVFPVYTFDRAKGRAFVDNLREGNPHPAPLILISEDRKKGYDLRDGLRKLEAPVLIIQGHQDPMGQKTAEDIHAAIRGSRLKYFSRCGHFPWIERPGLFREAVAEFLQGN